MFELTKLGWSSFQQLCLSITREILGQTVESFLDTYDGGRDGAFIGNWKAIGQEGLSGKFVIQCKFTSRENHNIIASDLEDEISKVKRLVSTNNCDSYILMTNAGVTGKQAEEINKQFQDAGVKYFQIFGKTWINQQILENKRLRMLVPRVYGIGDLSQILDERAYAQTRAILETLREDLSKVVVTEAYRKAIAALNDYGFVLLLGEPAVGKTTIASMLAMAAIDNWNSSILKLDSPEKTVEHWNPNEPTQFFWIDDAFGVSQYEEDLVRRWNHIFPQLSSMLNGGSKVVLTSRDYIYKRAVKVLKTSVFPRLLESQVIIDVQDLTIEERRQILYNHMKLGRQPGSFRTAVKPHLESIASHKRFIPESARRLSNPFFTKNLPISNYYLAEFIEKREDFLKEVLKNLDTDRKAALGLIFIRKNHLQSPISLEVTEIDVLSRLGSNLAGCITALEALNGSLVYYSTGEGQPFWTYKHPTIGDAYSAILSESPEQIGIYLLGVDISDLFGQCTCGNMDLENAIIIPESLFPEVMKKIEIAKSGPYINNAYQGWTLDSMVQRFLSYRCSREFLSRYIDANPDLLETVSQPGLYLSAVSEVGLAVRLYEVGLLPEKNRKAFVNCVSNYAIDGQDLFAMDNEKIKTLFTKSEFTKLIDRVREELPSKLENVRTDFEYNHREEDSAEDTMRPFIDTLEVLKRYYGENFEIDEILDEQTRLMNDWISENTPPEQDIDKTEFRSLESMETVKTLRSIFDDVDE